MQGQTSEQPMSAFEGRTLAGRYVLESLLGQGAFGAVYVTRQSFLGRPVRSVALKLSKRVQIDEVTARELFADAFLLAEALDEIGDPEARSHFVQVFDVGLLPEANNRAYMVMEFVEGTTLARQFAAYPRGVPGPVLLRWARQLAKGMAALHQLEPQVIHRDLKPDNVLLGGRDRHVRIVDFGLASRVLAHGWVQGVAGTTAYMAPETMLGPGFSRPASDVYSIGILLYEGLTGTHPFGHVNPPLDLPSREECQWLCRQRKRLRPEPPSRINPSVSPHLDRVILRCLEYEHENRYVHAGALLEDLEEPAPTPGADRVLECRALREAGSLTEAYQEAVMALKDGSIAKEVRFGLMREKGRIAAQMGDYQDAAASLESAWELTRGAAILRTRAERARLLGEIEAAYRQMCNPYMAQRYKDEREREERGKQ